MKKGNKFLIFIGYTAAIFFVATLLVILFFRLFPERTLLVFLTSPFFGLLFGLLCYLPYKSLTEK